MGFLKPKKPKVPAAVERARRIAREGPDPARLLERELRRRRRAVGLEDVLPGPDELGRALLGQVGGDRPDLRAIRRRLLLGG